MQGWKMRELLKKGADVENAGLENAGTDR